MSAPPYNVVVGTPVQLGDGIAEMAPLGAQPYCPPQLPRTRPDPAPMPVHTDEAQRAVEVKRRTEAARRLGIRLGSAISLSPDLRGLRSNVTRSQNDVVDCILDAGPDSAADRWYVLSSECTTLPQEGGQSLHTFADGSSILCYFQTVVFRAGSGGVMACSGWSNAPTVIQHNGVGSTPRSAVFTIRNADDAGMTGPVLYDDRILLESADGSFMSVYSAASGDSSLPGPPPRLECLMYGEGLCSTLKIQMHESVLCINDSVRVIAVSPSTGEDVGQLTGTKEGAPPKVLPLEQSGASMGNAIATAVLGNGRRGAGKAGALASAMRPFKLCSHDGKNFHERNRPSGPILFDGDSVSLKHLLDGSFDKSDFFLKAAAAEGADSKTSSCSDVVLSSWTRRQKEEDAWTIHAFDSTLGGMNAAFAMAQKGGSASVTPPLRLQVQSGEVVTLLSPGGTPLSAASPITGEMCSAWRLVFEPTSSNHMGGAYDPESIKFLPAGSKRYQLYSVDKF